MPGIYFRQCLADRLCGFRSLLTSFSLVSERLSSYFKPVRQNSDAEMLKCGFFNALDYALTPVSGWDRGISAEDTILQ